MITTLSPSLLVQPIPLHEPQLAGNEWSYLRDCLDTGSVSSVGDYVKRFEKGMAERAWTRHAVAVSSGSAGLHTALLVAGVQPEDEVLVSTLTFIAPANAIRQVGAFPVFVDAEPNYWQLDPQRIAEFLQKGCERRGGELVNRATGRVVRAIIAVHVLGHPVDLDAIRELGRRHGVVVLEDAAEAVGVDYKARPVGQTDSIAVYSFSGDKIITTGGGGMILTDNQAWAERARYLSTNARDSQTEFIHHEVGYNYRMTNLQAALGLAQLEQLEDFVAQKRAIARRYAMGLANTPGIGVMQEAAWARSTYWLYTIQVDEEVYGRSNRELANCLAGMEIQSRLLWQPLHKSKAHAGSFTLGGEVAERVHQRALCLPSSVGLNLEVVDEIARTIQNLGR